MKVNVYAIYDQKGGFYNKPFYLINHQVCERTIQDLVTDTQTDIGRHPEDFVVFHLGTYDDSVCKFDLSDAPVVLYRCHEVQQKVWSTSAVDQAETDEQVEE